MLLQDWGCRRFMDDRNYRWNPNAHDWHSMATHAGGYKDTFHANSSIRSTKKKWKVCSLHLQRSSSKVLPHSNKMVECSWRTRENDSIYEVCMIDDYLIMTGFNWCVTSIYGTIWPQRNSHQIISSAILTWTPTTCYQMMSRGTLAHWDSMQRWYVSPLSFVILPSNSSQAIYCNWPTSLFMGNHSLLCASKLSKSRSVC